LFPTGEALSKKKNHVELQPSVIHQAKAAQPDTASSGDSSAKHLLPWNDYEPNKSRNAKRRQGICCFVVSER
jgi:hypothetical protein